MAFKKIKFQIVFLIIIGFLVYFNSINAPFIYDDNALVVNNVLIRSFSNIPVLFKDIFHLEIMGDSFRPLQPISYMMDYKIWGLHPLGYHLTNIIIHIFNTILLYFLALLLIKKRVPAFLTALFFLIHPVNTPAVSYVSGRADLLAGLFFLLSLLLYISFLESRKILLILSALPLFALGVLSKEIVLISPLIFICYEIIFKGKVSKAIWPFILVSLAYIFLRSIALLPFAGCPVSLRMRFLTFPVLFFKYLGIIFFPVNLRLSYAVNFVSSFQSLGFIIPLLLLMLVIGSGVYLVKNKKPQLFGLLWYLINFAFISNVVYPLNAPFAEHWLYLGLAGILFFIIPVVTEVLSKKNNFMRRGIVLIFCFAVFYSFLTIRRNREWSDEVRFYNKEIRFTPANFKAHFNLGLAYFNRKDYFKAEEEFKKVLNFNPNLSAALFMLGLINEQKKDFKQAIYCYREVLKKDPGFTPAQARLKVLQLESLK